MNRWQDWYDQGLRDLEKATFLLVTLMAMWPGIRRIILPRNKPKRQSMRRLKSCGSVKAFWLEREERALHDSS